MNWLLGLFSPLWRESMRRRLFAISPVLVVLLAAGLRHYHIDAQSLWYDEGNTVRLVQRSIPDLIAAASRDIHPPGYYLVLKAWYTLTGDSELALRLFSALCGTLTVALTMALGWQLHSRGVGLIAALLVATNTFSAYYGQEARMYAALQLLAAASMWCFVRWFDHPLPRRALVVALINAAGLYTQYMFSFVMVAQGVMVLVWLLISATQARPATHPQEQNKSRWRAFAEFVILNVITMALFLPQIGIALAQVTQWPRTGQPVDPLVGAGTLAHWLIFGSTARSVEGWLTLAMLAVGAVGLFPDWLSHPRPYWWRLALPVMWLVAAVVPFVALNLFREANLKFLLPAQLAAALLVGRGLWWLWQVGSPNLFLIREALPRYVAIFGGWYLLLAIFGALGGLYTDPAFARDNYRGLAQTLVADARPGDAIILNAPNQQEVFGYYYSDRFRGSAPIYLLPAGLTPDDNRTQQEVSQIINRHRRIFVVYYGDAERDPNRVVEKTLTMQAFEVSTAWYGEVRLTQYAAPPTTRVPLTTQPVRFGESIMLLDSTISAVTAQPGDVIAVTLRWQTDRKLERRYKVFLHLLNAAGTLVAQRDAEPGNYLAITTTWEPGQPVEDAHGLLLPPTLPPGSYRLILGLYDIDDPIRRLPVRNADWLELTAITVVGR